MHKNQLDVDNIITQYINSQGKNVKIREKDISSLCKLAREVFMEQPVFLELEAPIKICGKSYFVFDAFELIRLV
jgi:serine/threonine-protein phosphatase PP1 catalytic subunit